MLSDQWTIEQFYPMDWLQNGVRLTAYSGEAEDLPATILQEFLEGVASGNALVPVGATYRMEDIVQAHRDLEANTVGGKAVVLP
jgi:NADPH2:quinone reductase